MRVLIFNFPGVLKINYYVNIRFQSSTLTLLLFSKTGMDPLAVIYNEDNWRINDLSQMVNLQYTPIKFKQYATKIRKELEKNIGGNSDLQYTVLMEQQPYLKYSETDPAGIMITVCKTQTNQEMYVAILLAWGTGYRRSHSTYLPHMIERGDKTVSNTVKNVIKVTFDCNITECNFTQSQIVKVLFAFLDNDNSRYTDPLELTFKLPRSRSDLKMCITFEIGDVRTLRKCANDEIESDVDYAYLFIEKQILYGFEVNVNQMDLCNVKFPKAEIKSNGILKMKTPEMVNAVFQILAND